MNTFFRTAATFSALALFGAGCAPAAPTPAPSVPSTPTVEVPASEPGHPPVVVMTVGEETYPGVEGSYCYEGVCVDKIGPDALVTEAALPFKDVASGSQLDFTVGGEVFEFAAGMMNASGTDLGLRLPVSFRNGKYNFKIPASVGGKVLVSAMVRFGQTGSDDVTYVFPVNVR